MIFLFFLENIAKLLLYEEALKNYAAKNIGERYRRLYTYVRTVKLVKNCYEFLKFWVFNVHGQSFFLTLWNMCRFSCELWITYSQRNPVYPSNSLLYSDFNSCIHLCVCVFSYMQSFHMCGFVWANHNQIHDSSITGILCAA